MIAIECPKCHQKRAVPIMERFSITTIFHGYRCQACGHEWDAAADQGNAGHGHVGQVTAHLDGDEDGEIIGWSFNVGDGRIIYCGEITNARFAELDKDARAAFGGKPFGWFLMCFWQDRSEVWAKCAGDDEARHLVTLIGSMLYAGKLWRDDDAAGARAMVDDAT